MWRHARCDFLHYASACAAIYIDEKRETEGCSAKGTVNLEQDTGLLKESLAEGVETFLKMLEMLSTLKDAGVEKQEDIEKVA